MILVSNKEFKKYTTEIYQMALNEPVVIKWKKNMFYLIGVNDDFGDEVYDLADEEEPDNEEEMYK